MCLSYGILIEFSYPISLNFILTTKQTFKVSYVRLYVLLWSSPTYSIIILLFYSWTQSKAALRIMNFQCEKDILMNTNFFPFHQKVISV
jgi:hypothetical protein